MTIARTSLARLAAGTALATVVALGAVPGSAFAATPRPTAAASQRSTGHWVPRLASAWVAAWHSPDPHRLAALFTRDAVYTDRGVGKVSYGQAGVLTWQANTHKLIPDVNASIIDAFRSGDRMLIETVYRGQIVGAPHPFAVPMATVLHLRGHRIVTDTDYYSLSELLRQSGLPSTWTPPAA